MKAPLKYEIRHPKVASKNPPVLLLLHGYGSNEMDLFSFAYSLPDELLIVSAQGPYEYSYGVNAWYEISFNEEDEKYTNLKQAHDSLKKVDQFIDYLTLKYHANPQKVFVLGFSQGAVLSYALSFLNPNKIQHIIALSGYIDTHLLPENEVDFNSLKTDYYVSHGTVDQVIPIDWARKTPIFLEKHQLKHSYTEYPVGHTVAPQNFASFKEWILERL